MAAPLVGITTYARHEGWFRLPVEYVDSVRRAGGIAVLLPPGETRVVEWLESVDALVLAGGGDVDPARYGGGAHATIADVDTERDDLELRLVGALLDGCLPTLCVCRGMQILNVALGGSLVADLPSRLGVDHRVPPRLATTHPVSVEPASALARVLDATAIDPVSWHHQAIDALGRGLRVVARAPDGVIEAVELEGRPELVAVQWHPEMTTASDRTQQRLFDHLVFEASRRI